MKYGVVEDLFPYTDCRKTINIGDFFQLLILSKLTQKTVGKEVVKLRLCDLKSYSGEDIVVPIQWALHPAFMQGNKIAISSHIRPVFVSMHLSAEHQEDYFNSYNVDYLKRHAPIGCRDEVTRDVYKSYGIESYLVGCVTHLLPQRGVHGKKTFLIDTPLELEKLIPNDLMNDVAVYSQQREISYENRKSVENSIIRYYEEIKKNAAIVVTSRLHVASPCIAWGIPVILAKNVIDERFSWIDKYIPLYSAKDYSLINWQPKQIAYEEEKKYIFDTISMWINNPVRNDVICERLADIDDYFNARNKRVYTDFRKVLFESHRERIDDLMKNSNSGCKFSIFGLGHSGEAAYSYISANYPKAELVFAVDNFKTGNWHGRQIITLDNYLERTSHFKDNILFIASVGGGEAAHYKLYGKMQYRICYLQDRFITRS